MNKITWYLTWKTPVLFVQTISQKHWRNDDRPVLFKRFFKGWESEFGWGNLYMFLISIAYMDLSGPLAYWYTGPRGTRGTPQGNDLMLDKNHYRYKHIFEYTNLTIYMTIFLYMYINNYSIIYIYSYVYITIYIYICTVIYIYTPHHLHIFTWYPLNTSRGSSYCDSHLSPQIFWMSACSQWLVQWMRTVQLEVDSDVHYPLVNIQKAIEHDHL